MVVTGSNIRPYFGGQSKAASSANVSYCDSVFLSFTRPWRGAINHSREEKTFRSDLPLAQLSAR